MKITPPGETGPKGSPTKSTPPSPPSTPPSASSAKDVPSLLESQPTSKESLAAIATAAVLLFLTKNEIDFTHGMLPAPNDEKTILSLIRLTDGRGFLFSVRELRRSDAEEEPGRDEP